MRGVVLLVGLCACVPPVALPPMVPAFPNDADGMLGVSASVGGFYDTNLRNNLTENPDPNAYRDFTFLGDNTGGGLFWVTHKIKPGSPTEAGMLLFAGNPYLAGLGWMLRYTKPNARGNLILGAEGQLGLFWLSASVPVALRLRDEIWLYTSPTLTLSSTSPLKLPLGLSFRLGRRFSVTSEVCAGLNPFGEKTRFTFVLEPPEFLDQLVLHASDQVLLSGSTGIVYHF